jgi:hypothetical protein
VWATGYLSKDMANISQESTSTNRWDLQDARAHYFTYLTGMDNARNVIAPDLASREGHLSQSLRAIGQIMHLLQDSAVPAHARNDFSQGHLMFNSGEGNNPLKKIGNNFEKFVERNNNGSFFNLPPVKSIFSDSRITDFWDTDAAIPWSTSGTGLAEYASTNFYSEYTIFAAEKYANDTGNIHYFPYPRKSSLDINDYFETQLLLPEEITSEDGLRDYRLYI